MVIAVTNPSVNTGSTRVVKVTGLTTAAGDSPWISAASSGFRSMVVSLVADVNATGAVTLEFEGAIDAAGTGAADIPPTTAFHIAATIAAGATPLVTEGRISVLPNFIRIKGHADITADLTAHLTLAKA